MCRWLLTSAIVMACSIQPAQAQPTIDGTLSGDEGSYGAALSIQNTNTQFGNATLGDPSNGGGGSEIDQVFASISGGRLYMLITGNLETNFNKLEVFIDSDGAAGGVNTIVGNQLPGGVDGFCCGGLAPPRDNNFTNFGALQRMDGLTFDAGFNADYYLTFTQGFESVNDGMQDETIFWAHSAHYADLTQGTAGANVAAGILLAPQGLPHAQRDPGVPLSGTPAVPDFPPTFGTMISDDPLPNLAGGELIDRTYAMADGGCTDDTGAGCIAPELAFVLDVDPSELPVVGGDYNGDGRVNAGDYTVWADTLGSTTDLRANGDDTGASQGVIDEADYVFWANEFGNEFNANASDHRNFVNTIDLQVATDNSNTAGVEFSGGDPFANTGDPENVVTGIEFSIPLSEIGNPAGDVRVTAFVNGGGHDFASNQFSGTGILVGNLAATNTVNLANIDGDQFVTVVQPLGTGTAIPEPGSLMLLVLAVAGLAGLRRAR